MRDITRKWWFLIFVPFRCRFVVVAERSLLNLFSVSQSVTQLSPIVSPTHHADDDDDDDDRVQGNLEQL